MDKIKLYWKYGTLRIPQGKNREDRELTISDIRIYKFKVEDNTIDNIEELNEEIAYTNLDYITNWNESEKRIVKQQNKILEAVKQLNKEIKELKER